MTQDANDIVREHGIDALRAALDGHRVVPQDARPLIQTSSEFVGNFEPPDYLIDGLLQRRFIYAMTAPTGTGKTSVALRIAAHVAIGLSLGEREVEQARVLFLAGENPDDVRMRWVKLCEEMGHDPDTLEVFFLPLTVKLSDSTVRAQIDAETEARGPFGLIIVDTSAAYFEGEDENSNTQAGTHARMLRSLVNIYGGPAIVVTCHPTKTPNRENMLPRGGGAFLAEVDGNLVCLKQGDNSIVELHWQGKLRGPDFAPISFRLVPGTSERLKDSKGRSIWSVTAQPLSEQEKASLEDSARGKQDDLMAVMKSKPGLSLAELAQELGWFYKNGEPNKSAVNRAIQVLAQDKLIEKKRGSWVLTKAGEKAAPITPSWAQQDEFTM